MKIPKQEYTAKFKALIVKRSRMVKPLVRSPATAYFGGFRTRVLGENHLLFRRSFQLPPPVSEFV
jgi:hypothetical protein